MKLQEVERLAVSPSLDPESKFVSRMPSRQWKLRLGTATIYREENFDEPLTGRT